MAAGRTPAGLAAADWLEVHGKGDIWKRYLDEATAAGAGERDRAASALDDDLALAGRLSTTAQRRFARPSPSAVEPGLRTHPRLSKLSYPSSHAIDAVSALVVLSTVDPGRARDFQQMAAQVLFSRLYAAGHYRSDLLAARDLYAFDNIVTAPLHGFKDTDDYWKRASAKPHMTNIAVPALALNALNDPFIPAWSLPTPGDVSGSVTLWQPAHGGHVGFPSGAYPANVRVMPEAVTAFLATHL